MNTYTINLINVVDGSLVGTDTVQGVDEQEALKNAKAAVKAAGLKLKDFKFEIVVPEVEDKEEEKKEDKEEEIVIVLDPANSPAVPGEKRVYPKAIKVEGVGTWWGCDQQKLLGTLLLNLHALDTFQVRHAGSRSTFLLGGTVIWSTTKGIAEVAESAARSLIESLKAA